MEGADAPHGLNMSLDDIIAENSKSRKLQNKNSNKGQHYGKSNNYQQGSRGRGRGGRGPGRGGGRGSQPYGRGGRGQQQMVQEQGFPQGYGQPERVVVVQEPDTSYRQVRQVL